MKNRKINLELKPMLGFRLLPDNHKSAGVNSAKVGNKNRVAMEAKVGGKTVITSATVGNQTTSRICAKIGDKNPDRFLLIGAKTGQKNG